VSEPAEIADLYDELGYTVFSVADKGHRPMLWPWTDRSHTDCCKSLLDRSHDWVRSYQNIVTAIRISPEYDDRDPEAMGVVAFPGCEFTIAEHVEAIFTTLDHDAAAGSFDAIGDRVAEIIEREAHHVPQENGGLVVLNHPRRYYDDPDEDWTRYVPLFETHTRPDGLVGMEVFNKEAPNNEDVRLWDLLLTEFSPDSQWESRLSTARAFREGRTLFHEREPWDSDAEDPAVPPTVESMSIASQGDEITIEASHYDSL
jgi:hypothetical protein